MSPSTLAGVADGLDHRTGFPVSWGSRYRGAAGSGLHRRWLLDQVAFPV